MRSCSRRFTFCAGHRLLDHKGRCRFPHGHNYTVWVVVEGTADEQGMVIDFGVLKQLVGTWIDRHWDHAFLVNPNDREMRDAIDHVSDVKVFIMPEEHPNPTAENIAKVLFDVSEGLLQEHDVQVKQVHVAETENGLAGAQGHGGPL